MKILAISLALILGGCAQFEDAYDYAKEKFRSGASKAAIAQCKRSENDRKDFLSDINKRIADKGKPHVAMAIDCDGDGKSDF